MSERKSIAAKAVYRERGAADEPAIRALTASAYAEARLPDAVLAAPSDAVALVAELEGEVIGHILLTPMAGPERALALAPLAVLPAWRDMQIGTELVRHALALARSKAWRSVFVFGQPDYYCRFGFKSHTADGAEIACQGPRFLALELQQGTLAGWTGSLDYPQPFVDLVSPH